MQPRGETEHEQDRDRIVEASLALEHQREPRRSDECRSSANTAAPSVDARVAPTSRPWSESGAEQHCRRRAGQQRCAIVPPTASSSAGRRTCRSACDRRAQPALEQDQRQRQHADAAGEREVVESHPARPVPPTAIPTTRNSRSPGSRRRSATTAPISAPASSSAGDEDQAAVVHGAIARVSRAGHRRPPSTFARCSPASRRRARTSARSRSPRVASAFADRPSAHADCRPAARAVDWSSMVCPTCRRWTARAARWCRSCGTAARATAPARPRARGPRRGAGHRRAGRDASAASGRARCALPDPSVSRAHARVTGTAAAPALDDVGSTDRHLGGWRAARIRQPVALRDGAVLRLGDVERGRRAAREMRRRRAERQSCPARATALTADGAMPLDTPRLRPGVRAQALGGAGGAAALGRSRTAESGAALRLDDARRRPACGCSTASTRWLRLLQRAEDRLGPEGPGAPGHAARRAGRPRPCSTASRPRSRLRRPRGWRGSAPRGALRRGPGRRMRSTRCTAAAAGGWRPTRACRDGRDRPGRAVRVRHAAGRRSGQAVRRRRPMSASAASSS